MKLLPVLFLVSIILLLTVPVTALSPSQIPKITAVKTAVPLHDIGQKVTVTTTPTTEQCGFDYPGYITIESEPPGANITLVLHKDPQMMPVDMKQMTPLSSQILSTCEGTYMTVTLRKSGYQDYSSDSFTIKYGQSHQIHAILIPLATTPGPAASPSGAAVVMTAPSVGTTMQVPVTGTIPPATAATGLPTSSPGPGTGSLSVTTNPAGAAVEIDGLPQGASPATIPGLAAGTHNLTITKPGYAVLVTQVSIVAGQANEYSTTLLPATEPTKKQSPGFELILAPLAVAGIALLKKIR